MNIAGLELQTNDLKATEIFYKDLLRLNLLSSTGEEICFAAGASTLCFKESVQPYPVYHFAFNIPPIKFEEAVLWGEKRFSLLPDEQGETVIEYPNWNARSFYFFDNNKNILEMIARYDLSSVQDDPFSAGSILCISEIGIVTKDPLKLADKLHVECNIPYFSKGGKTPVFVAMGDDEGLLIIVGGNKKWYPTELPAISHPGKILIRSATGLHALKTGDEE